ncbi:DeoR/GlpR family DNA-binding transcription regulator [Stratiformator vulcanicus]|uniref:Glucitol operon repressor n=1 Tax=Stratiformator vulcanicus TaxID=2527980 RepID=A0A517QY02_9PLAN|nr:DeoR/GlpR family DNA-binding transcription regulator [Stratiformator vulcanicus]QDT36494.1 Glucitol operon repressor [Stratiformator vulcanicus]
MIVDERRAKILKEIEDSGFISLQVLTDRVGASESTVRRDLEHLDRIGQVRRTRGGAAVIDDTEQPFEDLRTESMEEKRKIAAAVVRLFEPGDAILLDAGTTAIEVARRLESMHLQIVTNSLPIANILAHRPEIELMMIGGIIDRSSGVALGPMALAALSGVRVRRLVMGVGGVTEQGLFNKNTLLVDMERRMIDTADEVIVAAHSAKFGRSAISPLCSFDAVDRIVTDDALPDRWRDVIKSKQVALTVAT